MTLMMHYAEQLAEIAGSTAEEVAAAGIAEVDSDDGDRNLIASEERQYDLIHHHESRSDEPSEQYD